MFFYCLKNLEEKVPFNSSISINLSNTTNNLDNNTDKEIINNLVSFNKNKKTLSNENNNATLNFNSNSNNNNSKLLNFKIQNLGISSYLNSNNMIQQVNSNPQSCNNSIDPLKLNYSANIISANENKNNLKDENLNLNKNNHNNNISLSQQSNSNPNNTNQEISKNQLNISHDINKPNNKSNSNTKNINNNPNLPTINNYNLNLSQLISNKLDNPDNNNQNFISENYQNQRLIDNNNDLNTESKLDLLNNLISQSIDELYFTTKENIGNLNDDGTNFTNIIMNFEENKDDLSNKLNLKKILDDLKRQFFSINYYSLLQKLFMSYIFKNMETFVEQISKNQCLGEFIINSIIQSIPKLQDCNEIKNNPNILQINNLLNNINEQINALKSTNNQGQVVTLSFNGIFEELKNNGNKIFENIENSNKNSNLLEDNLTANNPFNLPNFDLNNFDMNMKSSKLKQQNLIIPGLVNNNNNNPALINLQSNLNTQKELLTNSNKAEILSGALLQSKLNTPLNLNQIQIESKASNNSQNIFNKDSNNKVINPEFSLNNSANNRNNQSLNNEITNSINLGQLNASGSKEKLLGKANNSLSYPLLFQQNIDNNQERNLLIQNLNNAQTETNNPLNYYNQNNLLLQNMFNMGTLKHPNQISNQPSSNILHANLNSPIGLNNVNLDSQIQILEKIIAPKNYINNNLNKVNQQELNLHSELAAGNVTLPTASGISNLNLMNGLIQNLQIPQISGNITNTNPLIPLNYQVPLDVHSINSNSLNNPLISQQQQILQLLNAKNQLLPLQLGGGHFLNPINQTMNIDLLKQLQGGAVVINNISGTNPMLDNQSLGLMGSGLNINQRLLLEGNF